jgi:hypothetical protein
MSFLFKQLVQCQHIFMIQYLLDMGLAVLNSVADIIACPSAEPVPMRPVLLQQIGIWDRAVLRQRD